MSPSELRFVAKTRFTTREPLRRCMRYLCDWAADIRSCDEGNQHMLMFADLLSDGIAKHGASSRLAKLPRRSPRGSALATPMCVRSDSEQAWMSFLARLRPISPGTSNGGSSRTTRNSGKSRRSATGVVRPRRRRRRLKLFRSDEARWAGTPMATSAARTF